MLTKLIVVIPAYNEEKTISQVIQGVKGITNHIIVVDDGSQDNTYLKAKKATEDTIVLRHKINLGKGAALKTGCEAALRLGADMIALMDADGQHLPEDLFHLSRKLEKENLDIVFGVREMDKNMPLAMYLGNKFLTQVVNLLFRISIEDTQSGLKVFRKDIYPKLQWSSSDYSAETEMIINTAKHNLRFSQLPIQTIYKDTYKGTTILDGIRVLFHILKWRFL